MLVEVIISTCNQTYITWGYIKKNKNVLGIVGECVIKVLELTACSMNPWAFDIIRWINTNKQTIIIITKFGRF